jgi:segregation and condensation protein A
VLARLIGNTREWASLDSYLIEYLVEPEMRTSVLASTFAASLELVREGKLEMQQSDAFAPLYMRNARKPNTETPAVWST